MSQKELQRVSVISRCIKGDMACASAAELLSLSVRHIKRLKKRLREGGEAALAHANRGRPSHRRLPERTRQALLRLARSQYAGFNDHHLAEKLNEVEGFHLSRETLRRLLRKEGLGSPRKRRAPAHRQRRLRVAREGELVQLDGSPHDWLEGRGPHLTALGMQDDATGKILAAQFFLSETTEGYFHLLQSVLRRFGVPTAFYGDRSGIFVRNDDSWTLEEELAGQRQPTQFGRALAELGITFIAAQSPQAKGRVERLWGVLQDRLCSELRLAGACDWDSANRVLHRFIADYNRRFARAPRETAKAWRRAPKDLTRVCAFRHDRVVSNDNVVQWEGRRLQIPPQQRRFSFAGATVQLYQALDGRVSLFYGDTRLEHTNASGG
ncbi:MAG TPA: ISNCY family transposase [Candidatus Acidoferrales bacterium]|nr:ISNCY family transposase [Candidatus Acidoferrales bacterium]